MKFIIFLTLILLANVIAFDLRGFQSRETVKQDAAGSQHFPYQACIAFQQDVLERSLCSGSVIDNEWILTAAHCAMNAVNAIVYLGAATGTTAQVVYNVPEDDIIIHPDWDTNTGDHNIALIKIPYTDYSDDIQPIKLPSTSSFYVNYNGDSAIAIGWHHESDTFSRSESKLKSTPLQILPKKICNKLNAALMPSRAICAVALESVAACSNDSGGPLVLEFSEVLIGVNALQDPTDCSETYSAVFTPVAGYLDWINSYTGISQ